ncbi:unnamed protein product, partial [Allacma fusca]
MMGHVFGLLEETIIIEPMTE